MNSLPKHRYFNSLLGLTAFRPASVAPTLLLATRTSIAGSTSLYCNVGGSWGRTAGTGLYAILLGGPLFGDLSGFMEAYGSFPPGPQRPSHAIDAGLAYALAPNLQVDLHGGVGLTVGAIDRFLNAGISFRLPC